MRLLCRMSQKNHIEIGIFKEPEHHLNPNQVHLRPLLPPKKQINQSNVISGCLKTFDFQPGFLLSRVLDSGA